MTTRRTQRSAACSAVIFLCGLFAFVASARAAGGYIVVTDAGAPSSTTCTLAQAIATANAANGVVAANVGSATTNKGTCSGALSGLNEIDLSTMSVATITLTTIDNYWYGPNALPPIASSILLVGGSKTLLAQHVGDPTPATANAFRFFYVSGGMELPTGSLTLENIALKGGYAKGGDSTFGGGGAGMGGAIFNQGTLTLRNVSLIGNVAQGGIINSDTIVSGGAYAGGGMGEDVDSDSSSGGGFGGGLGGSYGGSGGSGNASGSGGGGGGFVNDSTGAAALSSGGAGGGDGALGGKGGSPGASPPNGGDGGGGGGFSGTGGSGATGGSFGAGSPSPLSFGAGGGGGVGGGGSAGSANVSSSGCGGGGSFGGGGGSGGIAGGVVGLNVATGGFGGFGGGGGGAAFSSLSGGGGGGGFGGGSGLGGGSSHGGGGAGMGGAIFNHTGSVTMLNVTATGSAARGGAGTSGSGNGGGLGSVLFNLNGTVTIDFSTLAGNVLSGNNGQADSGGPEDGTVYSLAYGNKIQDGTASSASLTINNSIIYATLADASTNGNDVVANLVNGNNTNSSTLVYSGSNLVAHSYATGGVVPSGSGSTSASDPKLGALSFYRSSPNVLPVLPIGSNSPAQYAATNCYEADGSTTLTTDERGASRPYEAVCYLGAYQFDGDYIFANGNEQTL